MKYLLRRYASVILLLLFISPTIQASPWSKHKARVWVESRAWCNGLKDVMPYKTTDMVQFATQYHKQQQRWDKVFSWMATHDVSKLAPGRYAIDGDHCFANVQDAKLRPATEVKIESHRKYIDLQWCVVGTERFGVVTKPHSATIEKPYVPDIMLWTSSKVKYADSTPGTFFLYFPNNYHKACVQSDGTSQTVRKVCIKIEYDY